jgi:hypothetical protein
MANEYPATKPEGNFEIITLREFGRRRNVSERAVRQAVAAGKIPTGIFQTPEMKHPKVAFELAAMEWDASGGATHKMDRITYLDGQNDTSEKNNKAAPEGEKKQFGNNRELSDLKTQTAKIDLQTKQIALAELTKQLVRKSSVHSALFIIGQQLRDALQRIPARVIDDVMAAPSRTEAELILSDAIAVELERIADLHTREIA